MVINFKIRNKEKEITIISQRFTQEKSGLEERLNALNKELSDLLLKLQTLMDETNCIQDFAKMQSN